MTFATILPLIVQCKHTSRENALAPNLQQVSDETNNEASEKVRSVSQTMSERSDCVIDIVRETQSCSPGWVGHDLRGLLDVKGIADPKRKICYYLLTLMVVSNPYVSIYSYDT